MPRAYISNAMFIAQHHYFRTALDGGSIFRARGRRSAGAKLGVNDCARSVGMEGPSDAANYARDLGFFSGENALVWQQDRCEKPEDKRTAGNAADRGEQQDHRGKETTMRAQQVANGAKPTKKCGNGEAVEIRHAVGRMAMPNLCTAMRQMKVGVAAEVKVAPVHVPAGEERECTQQKAQDEADEIEDFPRHFCFTEFRVVFVLAGFLSGFACASRRCSAVSAAGRRIS